MLTATVARELDAAELNTPDMPAKNRSPAEDPEEDLYQEYAVTPSAIKPSPVCLTGWLQHHTALPATLNLRGLLPREYQLTAKQFNLDRS